MAEHEQRQITDEQFHDATLIWNYHQMGRNTWRESAHVAIAILAAMAAAAGAAHALPSMGVGADGRPWLILGAAVPAATLVAGWGRVTRILKLFPA
ncbi:hypothetical protein ACHBTE_08720 [Streptomyces sp. M41]|uniref:hypothetical protein n=1 Tax=Streptomyces sp. M41 TaxID=3059412 RepID=UPI00374CCB25